MKRLASAALVTIAIAATRPALAQQYVFGASAEAGSGVMGGARGSANVLSRARTRLRLGGDARIDESPEDIFGLAALIEVEPRAALGADARYMRKIGTRFTVNAGLLGYFAPGTFLGGSMGLTYRLPLSAHTAFIVGPELDVFFLGSDLPDGSVIWQGLLQAGFRADLL